MVVTGKAVCPRVLLPAGAAESVPGSTRPCLAPWAQEGADAGADEDARLMVVADKDVLCTGVMCDSCGRGSV